MSEAVSALDGASFEGYVTVRDAGLTGMITLRGDLSSAKVKKAVKTVAGTDVPAARGVTAKDGKSVAWMSPDELLILVPYADAEAAVADLSAALAGEHALAVNVSDARAVFRLDGAAVREVLAKLAPADLSPQGLPAMEMRRTRLAQVAAAFWLSDGQTAHVVCFRSVGRYVFDLLSHAAKPGSEVGYFADGS